MFRSVFRRNAEREASTNLEEGLVGTSAKGLVGSSSDQYQLDISPLDETYMPQVKTKRLAGPEQLSVHLVCGGVLWCHNISAEVRVMVPRRIMEASEIAELRKKKKSNTETIAKCGVDGQHFLEKLEKETTKLRNIQAEREVAKQALVLLKKWKGDDAHFTLAQYKILKKFYATAQDGNGAACLQQFLEHVPDLQRSASPSPQHRR